MTSQAKHITVNLPGRMESHPTHRARAYPYCTLQQLDLEDLHTTMCEAIHDSDKTLLPRTDEEVFKMHVEFVRAHGIPKGEYTTFFCGAVLKGNNGRDE